jgi:hypothetical protein
MPSQRALEAFLRFTLDEQSAGRVAKSIEKVKKEFKKLEDQAGQLQQAIQISLAHGQDAGKLERELAEVQAKMKAVAAPAEKKLGAQLFEQTRAGLEPLNEMGDRLETISVRLGVLGAGIGVPLISLAQRYADSAGMATETGRQWTAVTQDLERSQLRLGQTTAQALLPVMEKLAGFMQQAADFAQAHPGAVQAALGLAGGLTVAGGLGALASQGIKLYTDAVLPIAAALQKAAAKDMLVAAGIQAGAAKGGLTGGVAGLGKAALGVAMGVGGAAALGVASAVGVNQLFAGWQKDLGGFGDKLNEVVKSPFFEAIGAPFGAQGFAKFFANQGLGQSIGFTGLEKYPAVLAAAAGSVFGDETSIKWFETVAKWTGQIADNAPEAEKAIQGTDLISQASLDAFIAFRQAEADAESLYSKQRSGIIDQAGQQQAELTQRTEERRTSLIEEFAARQEEALADFNRQQARQQRDFDRQEAGALADFNRDQAQAMEEARQQEQDAEDEYYKHRTEMVADFDKETQRQEADHQKEMKRLQQDHQASLQDAIRNQSVAAFLAEQRNYGQQRRRREEDYRDQVSRRDEDFAAQLAETEAQFEEQRAARQANREAQLAETQAQFEHERAERLADYELKLKDQQEEFDLQQKAQQAQQDKALAQLEDQYKKESTAINEKKGEQLRALDSQYGEEKAKRQSAFADQLRDLDAALLGEQETRLEYYAAMEDDFKKWLENMQGHIGSNLPFPHRHTGGYVGSGLYNLLAGEYVLNRATVGRAESLMGGSLTQGTLLAALASGRSGGSRSMSFNQNITFNDRDDRQAIINEIDRRIGDRLVRHERGY